MTEESTDPELAPLPASGTPILDAFRLKTVLTIFISVLLAALSATSFALVARIFSKLGPAVHADLVWQAQHGARELAQALELPVVLRDPEMIADVLADYENPDMLSLEVRDASGERLVVHGRRLGPGVLFAGPSSKVRESDAYLVSWEPVSIERNRVGTVAVAISTARLKSEARMREVMLAAVVLACTVAIGVSVFFVRQYLGPIIQLTERTLLALGTLNTTLDANVRRRTLALSEANLRLEESLAQQQKMQRELVEISRRTGMADVATAVLHNVGNVLNSVNVSAGMVMERVRRSRVESLAKSAQLLRDHEQDLGAFFASERGRLLPPYLGKLAEALVEEQGAILSELTGLQKNIDHIKTVIHVQQSHAGVGGVDEPCTLGELIEDALRYSLIEHGRTGIRIEREVAAGQQVCTDRHKVSQILLNLITNARDAVYAGTGPERRIVLRAGVEKETWRISVEDSGCGIPPENLDRIFNHGFTTKKDGHGFGLHSSACAAVELGGKLTCHSDGVGKGALFVLELPLQREESRDGTA